MTLSYYTNDGHPVRPSDRGDQRLLTVNGGLSSMVGVLTEAFCTLQADVMLPLLSDFTQMSLMTISTQCQ